MLTKKERKRIYERVSKRYRRLAKKLGQNWKEIEINGLRFKDAYESELWQEEYGQKMGSAPSKMKQDRSIPEKGFSPEEILRGIEESEEEIPSPHEPLDDEILRQLVRMGGIDPFKENPDREKQLKQIERVVNKMLEEQATKDICPICKSSICHCGENENVD